VLFSFVQQNDAIGIKLWVEQTYLKNVNKQKETFDHLVYVLLYCCHNTFHEQILLKKCFQNNSLSTVSHDGIIVTKKQKFLSISIDNQLTFRSDHQRLYELLKTKRAIQHLKMTLMIQ
jgi:hypothetical protein